MTMVLGVSRHALSALIIIVPRDVLLAQFVTFSDILAEPLLMPLKKDWNRAEYALFDNERNSDAAMMAPNVPIHANIFVLRGQSLAPISIMTTISVRTVNPPPLDLLSTIPESAMAVNIIPDILHFA